MVYLHASDYICQKLVGREMYLVVELLWIVIPGHNATPWGAGVKIFICSFFLRFLIKLVECTENTYHPGEFLRSFDTDINYVANLLACAQRRLLAWTKDGI